MDPSLKLATLMVGLGAAGALVGILAWLRPRNQALQLVAALVGWYALGLTWVAWIRRFQAAGHLPLFGTYESSLSLAAACLLAAAPWALRNGVRRAGLWPAACGVAAALLAHGLRYDPTIYALTISERSWVVDVHAVMAWAAFGVLAANAGLALWLLIRPLSSGDDFDPRAGSLAWTLSLGFALHTAMMVSGSFYKFLLFGSIWTFDPIETLGFVAWVAYGTLLHMHLFAGWEGRRLARWCLGLFLILVISYRGILYFPAWATYHIFDMDLRMHLTGGEDLPFGGGG